MRIRHKIIIAGAAGLVLAAGSATVGAWAATGASSQAVDFGDGRSPVNRSLGSMQLAMARTVRA